MEKLLLLQIAGVVSGILASLTAVYVAFRVKELHVMVNSRLTELLKATAKSERAEGKVEGRAEEKAEGLRAGE